MKSFRTIAIIIAILVGIVALFIPWFTHNPEIKQAIKIHEDSIIIAKAQITAIAAREKELLAKLKSDSAEHETIVKRQLNVIQKLKIKLAEARVIVQPEIDSLPEIKKIVDLQDSVIQVQDVAIDTLREQKKNQWVAFNKILTESEDKFKASEELNEHLAKINEIQADELVKKKRQNVGLKIGIVALGVLAILK